MTYSGCILSPMTRRTDRTRRNPFASALAQLGMLSSLAVLAGAMLATGDGGGGGAGGSGEGGGADTGGAGGAGAGSAGAGTEPPAETDKGTKVTFTAEQQAELDRIIADAKSKEAVRVKKATEDEIAQAAERAKMDEVERLKAEQADKDQAAAAKDAAANARIIRSDAKVAAVAAEVKADRVDAFLRVVDLTGIEVDDNGEPDAAAIKKAVADTLKDFPEFKGTAAAGASGGDFNDTGKPRAKSLADAVNAKIGA